MEWDYVRNVRDARHLIARDGMEGTYIEKLADALETVLADLDEERQNHRATVDQLMDLRAQLDAFATSEVRIGDRVVDSKWFPWMGRGPENPAPFINGEPH